MAPAKWLIALAALVLGACTLMPSPARMPSPASYAICIGVQPAGAGPGHWLGPVDPELVWALLPQPAQDLLAAGEPTTNQEWMHADAGCTLLTADDARTLDRALEAAGGVRGSSSPQWPSRWVGYAFNHPTDAWDLIWIQFAPVNSDGKAIWSGPG